LVPTQEELRDPDKEYQRKVVAGQIVRHDSKLLEPLLSQRFGPLKTLPNKPDFCLKLNLETIKIV
jgi:hypothetical protein